MPCFELPSAFTKQDELLKFWKYPEVTGAYHQEVPLSPRERFEIKLGRDYHKRQNAKKIVTFHEQLDIGLDILRPRKESAGGRRMLPFVASTADRLIRLFANGLKHYPTMLCGLQSIATIPEPSFGGSSTDCSPSNDALFSTRTSGVSSSAATGTKLRTGNSGFYFTRGRPG